jgi:hypothetical protein
MAVFFYMIVNQKGERKLFLVSFYKEDEVWTLIDKIQISYVMSIQPSLSPL